METADPRTGYSPWKTAAQDFGVPLLHDEHPVGPAQMVFVHLDPRLWRRAGAPHPDAGKGLEDLFGGPAAPLVTAADEEQAERLGQFPALDRSASSLRRVEAMTARMSSRFSSALESSWFSSSEIRCS